MLPGGIAEKMRRERAHGPGDSEQLDVTVLMSDIRGYSGDRGARRSRPRSPGSSTRTAPR